MRSLWGLLFAAAFSACHPTLTFDATVQGSSTVPGSPLGSVLPTVPDFSGLTNFNFSQTQDFQNQGVTSQDVDSVKMKSLTLQLTSPNNEDFSWLDSLTFSAAAGNQTDVIATKSGINQLGLAAPNPSFAMDVASVELKPYVTAPSMAITANGTGNAPPQDTTIQATVVVTVVANVVH